MLALLGLLVVLGSVVAGYVMERGHLLVLLQPAELVIIAGGALGIVLISCPSRNLRVLIRAFLAGYRERAYTREAYAEGLGLLYTLFQFSRRAGFDAIEPHIERPYESEIFQDHPGVLTDAASTTFVCDSLRMAISAGLNGEEIERLMSLDIEVQRSGRQQPLRVLMNVADSLPGLGIVAAVLGVVVTMQALGGPAADIGQKVAAALVGTFLGILLCYGVVGPLAHRLESLGRARSEYLHVLRIAITSFCGGTSPLVAAEAGRRSIPLDLRPSFEEMEDHLRHARIPLTPQQRQAMEQAQEREA